MVAKPAIQIAQSVKILQLSASNAVTLNTWALKIYVWIALSAVCYV